MEPMESEPGPRGRQRPQMELGLTSGASQTWDGRTPPSPPRLSLKEKVRSPGTLDVGLRRFRWEGSQPLFLNLNNANPLKSTLETPVILFGC